jgi:hypothetical protein
VATSPGFVASDGSNMDLRTKEASLVHALIAMPHHTPASSTNQPGNEHVTAINDKY